MKPSHILIAALCTFQAFVAIGQGCSDAGFCTMGAMKPDQDYDKDLNVKLRSIVINAYFGTTTLTPKIYSLTVDATISVTDRWFFQAKVPYQMVTGNFANTAGVSDLSFSLTRNMLNTKRGSLNATIGTKIPTNDSDLATTNGDFGPEGSDLPMYYQVSLGSYDFIAGASWINEKWLMATGVQVALTANKNDFKWSEWPNYPDKEFNEAGISDYVKAYDRATHLKRGTDVMLRLERNFRFTNYNFSIGVLPIFRVTHDQIITDGVYEKVDGTTGMALSVLVGAGYNFNVNSGLKLIIGKKITDREVNPDGLTRNEVVNFSYIYRF